MRFLPALALLTLAGCTASRPSPSVIAAASPDAPAALVTWRGGLAVAAGESVRGVEHGEVVWEAQVPGRVWDLAGTDTLWVASEAGLFALAGPNAEPDAVSGVPSPVLSVTEDASGRIWAASRRDGVWVRENGRWSQATPVSPVTGVVSRGDAVWMGSQQGVIRREGDAEVRFTEEGTTDHGLLDNVVDRLIETADGAVWAVHPEGVSIFADGEPHGFRFVGRPGAELYDVVSLPDGGYVLATAGGILYVASLSERPEGFYEVYADSGTGALSVAGAVPAALGGSPAVRLALSADGATVWFASQRGLWSVPVGAFRPAVAAPVAKRRPS